MSALPTPPEGDRDPRPAPPRAYRVIQSLEAPLSDLMGLSCREFARLTVTRLDRPLTASEALRHRFHGTLCGICARFATQFSFLNDLTREIETEDNAPPPPPSDRAAAARIAAAVRAEIKKSAD
jgi:hypothetical protein